ncbi:hypothetical protein I546_4433 [Mycobacterium kansasii 732]|nr:hypothetical protein I546_4433 [Mycobacterium kansasii 732]
MARPGAAHPCLKEILVFYRSTTQSIIDTVGRPLAREN